MLSLFEDNFWLDLFYSFLCESLLATLHNLGKLDFLPCDLNSFVIIAKKLLVKIEVVNKFP